MMTATQHAIKNSHRFFEISAVILTGCLKYVFVDILPFKFWYITIAVLFWAFYVLFRCIKNKSLLAYWGFEKKTFTQSFLRLFPFALVAVAAMIVFGFTQDTLLFNWHLFPVLLIYPFWGIVQQFLIVGLVAGNLKDLNTFRLSRISIVFITSIVFAIVHFPSRLLVLATFFLAIVYTFHYLKIRNIWALGLFHGWLGGFFYFFVLRRDPWVEVFSTF